MLVETLRSRGWMIPVGWPRRLGEVISGSIAGLSEHDAGERCRRNDD